MVDPTNENIIPKLRNPIITGIIGVIYLILIIITLVVLYSHGKFENSTEDPNGASRTNSTATIFIVIFFILIVISIIVLLIPPLSDVKKLIEQMSSLLFVIVNTIFLILLFRYLPSDTLDKYPYIITISTMIFSAAVFYNGFKTNYVKDFSITYEKIKTCVLFFCFITTLIIYYSVDPGGILKKYFNYVFLITILLSVFSFLYVVLVLTIPNASSSTKGGTHIPFAQYFSIWEWSVSTQFIVGINFLFIAFLICLFAGLITYPDGLSGFFSNPSESAFVVIFSLIIIILYAGMFIVYADEYNDNYKIQHMSNLLLFKKSLMILLGVVSVGLLIAWLGISIQKLSDNPTGSTIVGFILNALILLLVVYLIQKIMIQKLPSPQSTAKKNAFFDLIQKSILYIPCLLSEMMEKNKGTSIGKDPADIISIYIIAFVIIGGLLYGASMYIKKKLFIQGGKQLINEPIHTDIQKSIATYEDLNGNEDFNYRYGISFWLFLPAFPPNTNAYYSNYISVLNYGGKPNVLYNPKTNTMIITMPKSKVKRMKKLKNKSDKNKSDKNKSNVNTDDETKNDTKKINIDLTTALLDDYDSSNVIVYKLERVLLQKWNNIIINFSGGTLDIFYNNELVKSILGVVPYMSLDSLDVGTDDGLRAGICNLLYFKKPITAINSYYLYNSVKNQKIPVIV